LFTSANKSCLRHNIFKHHHHSLSGFLTKSYTSPMTLLTALSTRHKVLVNKGMLYYITLTFKQPCQRPASTAISVEETGNDQDIAVLALAASAER
jgi:hypothetical protein